MGALAMMMAQGAAAVPTVTWNPADKASSITLSSGNLVATKGGADSYGTVRATHGKSATDAGGFYYEVVISTGTTTPFIILGVANASQSLTGSVGSSVHGWSYYEDTGQKFTNNVGAAYGAAFTTGDVIGVLLKNSKIYFRKNGTWQNSADVDAETGFAYSGLSGTLFPAISLYRGTAPSHVITGRFKASSFSGSLPSGAAAWES